MENVLTVLKSKTFWFGLAVVLANFACDQMAVDPKTKDMVLYVLGLIATGVGGGVKLAGK